MKRVPKPLRVVAAAVVLLAAGGVVYAMISPRQGYAPPQPILFEHWRMAAKPNWTTQPDGKGGTREVNLGGYEIPCLYCHTMPYKGRHSTLPSTDICMNCHAVVGQDKEWIIRLKSEYWDTGKPIPWVKVHDLPDFVYYDHSAHLNVVDAEGKPKLDCIDCHGDVANMGVIETQNRFNMGWCLECHRKPEMAAPTDCVACHR